MEISLFYHFGKQQWYTFGTHENVSTFKEDGAECILGGCGSHFGPLDCSISSLSSRSDHWWSDFIALP